MKSAVCIINFETTRMTNYNVRRILALSDPRPTVYVLDNSAKNVFELEPDLRARVLKNNSGQLFDVDACMRKLDIRENGAKGAIQHMMSVQWFFDNLHEDDIVLVESDAIVKRNPLEIVDDRFLTCATPEEYNFRAELYQPRPLCDAIRLAPYLQYFNRRALVECSMKYMSDFIGNPCQRRKFRPDRTRQPDTGFYFFWSLRKKGLLNQVGEIRYSDYVDHLVSCSWKNLRRFDEYARAHPV